MAEKQEFAAKKNQLTKVKMRIEKMEVHAPRYVDGKRVQLLDIYFSGVGIVQEMTPERMEEAL